MAPSVMMIYGGSLRAPVFIVQRTGEDISKYASFWCGRSTPVLAQQLAARPYFNVAIFWLNSVWANPDSAQILLPTLKPEEAHQQARLYVPTADGKIGSAVVSTDYLRFTTPAGAPAVPMVRRIPTDSSEFKYGCWLSRADEQILHDLGVPGF
jgi:hypothetical protein